MGIAAPQNHRFRRKEKHGWDGISFPSVRESVALAALVTWGGEAPFSVWSGIDRLLLPRDPYMYACMYVCIYVLYIVE